MIPQRMQEETASKLRELLSKKAQSKSKSKAQKPDSRPGVAARRSEMLQKLESRARPALPRSWG